MKKHVLLLSMIAVLTLTGCGKHNEPSKEESISEESSIIVEPNSEKESKPESSQPTSQSSIQASSSKPASSRPPKSEADNNENFTLMEIDDVSSMSSNCKNMSMICALNNNV